MIKKIIVETFDDIPRVIELVNSMAKDGKVSVQVSEYLKSIEQFAMDEVNIQLPLPELRGVL